MSSAISSHLVTWPWIHLCFGRCQCQGWSSNWRSSAVLPPPWTIHVGHFQTFIVVNYYTTKFHCHFEVVTKARTISNMSHLQLTSSKFRQNSDKLQPQLLVIIQRKNCQPVCWILLRTRKFMWVKIATSAGHKNTWNRWWSIWNLSAISGNPSANSDDWVCN